MKLIRSSLFLTVHKKKRVEKLPSFGADAVILDIIYGGFLGCPTGGKTTLDVGYLAPAMRAGLKVRDLAEVRLISRCPGANPARYRSDYFDHHTMRPATIYAEDVILAAGTMNTLRILMASRAAGGLTGMPNLGQRFGTNGDYFGWWDWNKPDLDLTVALPSAGGVMVRGEQSPPTSPACAA